MEESPNLLSIVALCISSLGGLCALAGVVFTAIASHRAGKAERRAVKAEERAIESDQRAAASARRELWSAAIIALNEMVTYHAHSPEIQSKLTQLRISLMELADGLDKEQYPKLGEYLALIHGCTALMYERSLYELRELGDAPNEVMSSHGKVIDWLGANISNLRLLRGMGPGEPAAEVIQKGMENLTQIYETLRPQSDLWAQENPESAR